ncbi:Histone methyltransferase [Mycena kentingensis (nom. inval.)]|nr:Histone methyltransferase [Mycena kentingensis (nom. inval.)]
MALVKLEESPADPPQSQRADDFDGGVAGGVQAVVSKVEEGLELVKAEVESEASMLPTGSGAEEDTKSVAAPVQVPLWDDEGEDEVISEDEPEPSPTRDSTPATASRMSNSHSRSATPPSGASNAHGSKKKKKAAPVQLIGDLPIARDAALATFTELGANNYQNKSLGRSREALEGMSCECAFTSTFKLGGPSCGPHDNCINRLTLIECLDDCRGRGQCQNQRFQRKQYASIEIVQTEKKGFGLRAEEDIPKDGFIYEYVGDVVNPVSFKKRMRDYADEGIEHFYFMMLQRDEFIDATKAGGIGRFANHSCNPNCYVAKWTIGQFVRMGIFAKRNIQKNEELTFNYNVDRYGFKAQECFCGEPNCVGYLGGKTQTDIAAVDDLYLDALGITDEDDLIALKGNKKKKGKKIDDPDFKPNLTAITTPQVPKIINALKQTSSRAILVKLLTRFSLTTEEGTLREMLRLRCMTLMKQLLDDHYPKNMDIVGSIIGILRPWPLTTRNKVEMCQINESVQRIADEVEDEQLKIAATDLTSHWDSLPVGYRIPKRAVTGEEKTNNPLPVDSTELDSSYYITAEQPTRRPPPRPPRRSYGPAANLHIFSSVSDTFVLPPSPKRPSQAENKKKENDVIAAVLAQKEAEEAAAAAAAEAERARREAKREGKLKEKRKKSSSSKKTQTPEEREANKNKRLLKLVGAVVVKCMSKYGRGLEREKFKKYAKEALIAEKEKKSSSYRDNKLEALSEEKVAKMKKFSKDYIAKVVRKLEKDKTARKDRPPSASTPLASASTVDTPNSNEDADGDVDMPEMTVEEAMDMDPASGSDEDDEEDEEDDPDMAADVGAAAPSQTGMDDVEMGVAEPTDTDRTPSDVFPVPAGRRPDDENCTALDDGARTWSRVPINGVPMMA